MKSPAAYYLMLLYVTVMFKPLIPIIGDIWSHEFNEIEHISIVHAKYGSHHLQKEVADSGSGSENQKNQNTLKSGDEVPFHLVTNQSRYDLQLVSVNKNFLIFKSSILSPVTISRQGPPPKFSC